MAKLVSKVYGDALFEEAMESQCIEERYSEVLALKEILHEHEDLMRLLNHPQIVKEEKADVIKNIFSGRMSDSMVGFLLTVIDKGRQNELEAILDYFSGRVKEYKKIGVVHITSAMDLSEEQKEKIEKRILELTDFASLETDYKTDSSLIGGLVIRIGDRVVDSSVRTQLEKLKRELLNLQLA